MYVGHVGIALAAKGLRPRLPLALLLVAAFGVDFAEVAVKAVGLDEAVPDPVETLPVALALVVGFGAFTWALQRDAPAALVVAAVALTHPLGDLLTGTIPPWPGSPEVGLDLFQHRWVDLALEMGLVFAGWGLYCRSLSPAARGALGLWLMPPALLLLQVLFLSIG
ncbi:MAG: hypothetical protein R3362_08245 [Rhodothermales bacterium]|nr:hypothetical protein [Rhodothermales bacterium]